MDVKLQQSQDMSQVPQTPCVEFAYIAHQPEVFWVLQCLDIDGHPGFLFSPAVTMAHWDRKESLHSDLANLKAQSRRFDGNVQRLGWR